MPSSPQPLSVSPIEVVGARRHPFRDAYHFFLRSSWLVAIGTIAAGFLLMNFLFALIYFAVGGVAHAHPHSLLDAFFFSVQTSATIGYGAMYPESLAANLVVVAESVASLLVTALATGLVFAKFSRTTAVVVFSRQAVVAPHDGIPTLMVRIGNERGNTIADAQIRLILTRTERDAEGRTFYRLLDLPLIRDRLTALSRTWTVMHPITEASPLWQADAATLRAWDAELGVSLLGTDDISLQPVHARHAYDHPQICWNMRFADVLSERADGTLVIDLRRFHELVPIDAVTSSGPAAPLTAS
jgi:inward rectifier potassium channel